jgi:hypothetical protein
MRKASPGRSLTAAIYVVVTGRELRVHRGERVDDLIESRLSRVGDGPLEQRAGELRNILEAKGWNVGGD